jgi:hypothetical protein
LLQSVSGIELSRAWRGNQIIKGRIFIAHFFTRSLFFFFISASASLDLEDCVHCDHLFIRNSSDEDNAAPFYYVALLVALVTATVASSNDDNMSI